MPDIGAAADAFSVNSTGGPYVPGSRVGRNGDFGLAGVARPGVAQLDPDAPSVVSERIRQQEHRDVHRKAT
jgi:hypothetical protein